MRALSAIMGILIAASCSSMANAHRMNSALTAIEYGQNGKNSEVTHRIFVHDLEHALDLGNVGLKYFETVSGQKLVETYIRSNFFIQNGDKAISSKFIGAEIDGDLLYIYFEADLTTAQKIEIDSNILMDLTNAQVNYVNFHMRENTQTLIFDASTSLTEIKLVP